MRSISIRRRVVALGILAVLMLSAGVAVALAGPPAPPPPGGPAGPKPPPPPPPPPPPAPLTSPAKFFSSTNGQPASNGAATAVNEGLGGQGALLTSINDGGAGVDFDGAKNATFSQLTTLSTQYSLTQGTCSGGSPRFVVDVLPAGDKNMNDAVTLSVYFGTQPYGGCPTAGAQQEPNIVDPSSGSEWSVNYGDSFFTTSQVEATYGSYQLLDVQVQVDGGWAQTATLNPLDQQVLLQNLQINSNSYFPLPSA